MIQSLARFLASGFLSGFVPYAPGTAGSAACVLLWWLTHRLGFINSLATQIVVVVSCIVVGLMVVAICLRHPPAFGPLNGEPDAVVPSKAQRDPSYIVIDEWAGMLIALLGVPHTNLLAVGCAFVLFRLFDVIKPGPVRWAETLPGAYGVMCDDIVAGALTAFFMQLLVLCVVVL